MYDPFTDRAKKVMHLASQEAQRFNHEYVGTEHILIGIVKEGCGVAATVLKNVGVDLPKTRLEVEKILQSGPDAFTAGTLRPTPRAKLMLEYSIEEARRLNDHRVGTEHLLLGILRDANTVAAQVLLNLGLRLDQVREELLKLLGQNGVQDGTRGATTPALAEESKAPPVAAPAAGRRVSYWAARRRDAWLIAWSALGAFVGGMSRSVAGSGEAAIAYAVAGALVFGVIGSLILGREVRRS
jgi:ATP-dependent Clp protease ATP-binding subunit ClpC